MNKQLTEHGVLFFILCVLSSCIREDEFSNCPFNVQLEYWYTMERTTENNMIQNYIYTITEYIFDEQDILFAIKQLPVKGGTGEFRSETTLPTGRYTVVSWANLTDMEHDQLPEIGQTTKSDLSIHLGTAYSQLSQSNTSTVGIVDNISHIYYGYAMFSVRDKTISRIRVGMTNAYCLLDVTVKWATKAPANSHDFSLRLREVPGVSYSIPAYVDKGSVSTGNPADSYPVENKAIHYYIPGQYTEDWLKHHQVAVKMDITRSLHGEFITHRYTNETHPMFAVYAGDKQITREIDLHTYFQTKQIDLDRNLRQEFHIVVEIHENQILVFPAVISDWENGGIIGGQL